MILISTLCHCWCLHNFTYKPSWMIYTIWNFCVTLTIHASFLIEKVEKFVTLPYFNVLPFKRLLNHFFKHRNVIMTWNYFFLRIRLKKQTGYRQYSSIGIFLKKYVFLIAFHYLKYHIFYLNLILYFVAALILFKMISHMIILF